MAKQRYKNEKDDIIPLLPKACSDERAAVEFFEAQRWADCAPACPKCGSVDVYQMMKAGGAERQENFRWRCRDCKGQYTVRTGTIMEDSGLPLTVWAFAFWQACAGKKGVSAKQIERQCGISYKSALFVLHRVRWGMVETNGKPLTGTVEVDETFVGGKPRKMSKQEREAILARGEELPKPKRGRGRNHHVPVLAAVERCTGTVRTRVIADVTAANLREALAEMVDPTATLHTDEYNGYRPIGREYAGHETVNHSEKEYARGSVTTNSAEGFFARFERSIMGIHHRMSRQHLHRYATHMEFLHNNRNVTDGLRIRIAIQMADGKRLTYKQPAF